MLETGEFATVAELQSVKVIAPSYLARLLRLALLAPDIVEAVLDGRQGGQVTLAKLPDTLPEAWAEQQEMLKG